MSAITTPDHPQLDELCAALTAAADETDRLARWPAEQLRLCGDAGVFRWFLPASWGGYDWADQDVVRGYLKLSAACLTTTFVITQRTAACRRLVETEHRAAQDRWLPRLADDSAFATVGISHLTTSRRHLRKPVLAARTDGDGYRLEGFSPWVTGAPHADVVVTGATLDDGREILVALPMDSPGVETGPPAPLVGVSASHTGPVTCRDVRVEPDWLLAGPIENVMTSGSGAGTGGLQTSTLAIGLADAAISYLEREAERRPDLIRPAEGLRGEHRLLRDDLLAVAAGEPACSTDSLRARANQMALRATQAALSAAKGTGYVLGHPTGRWCREALFFLVWSCPQPVVAATLCELAGLGMDDDV